MGILAYLTVMTCMVLFLSWIYRKIDGKHSFKMSKELAGFLSLSIIVSLVFGYVIYYYTHNIYLLVYCTIATIVLLFIPD